MHEKRIDYFSWFIRVLAWDGFMPVVIIVTPFLVQKYFPNNRNAVEFTGIMLPLVGFIFRFFAGWIHIFSNHCGRVFRALQFGVLCFGLLSIIIIDTIFVLFHGREKDAFVSSADYLTCAGLYLIYLTSMIFAMYPGKTEISNGNGSIRV